MSDNTYTKDLDLKARALVAYNAEIERRLNEAGAKHRAFTAACLMKLEKLLELPEGLLADQTLEAHPGKGGIYYSITLEGLRFVMGDSSDPNIALAPPEEWLEREHIGNNPESWWDHRSWPLKGLSDLGYLLLTFEPDYS